MRVGLGVWVFGSDADDGGGDGDLGGCEEEEQARGVVGFCGA